jgi:2-C-methyl-D-erythritol 2,4-cyclodiphosphate synthase
MMPEHRVGLGIDFHRFATDRPLIIGGVRIPHDRGLIGHSDADVLVHALCDALLGAAGLGDIGTHFPDSDERYRGISSLKLLEQVIELLSRHGYRVVNVDATIIAQAPLLTPHFPAMQKVLTPILRLPNERISLKATTSEEMGALGRREGIGAMSICLIETA